MGYDVVGVDVGPAVLAHAKRSARRSQVAERTRFVRQDLRQLAQPQEFEAAVLVYHILEAFPRPDQRRILRRLRASLVPGGRLIVEMRTRSDHPEGRTSSWYVADSSLLADTPHLLLSDAFTDNRRNTFVLRETAVLDDGSVLAQHTSSAMTTLDRIPGLFDQAGFRVRAIYEGWSAYRADMTSPAVVVVAEAPR
jgi:SAM-dependent methyltransferase